ncbi:Uncharacterized protein FKW44_013584, partial [Caligus rogercresseyi]
MDLLTAYRLVMGTEDGLKKCDAADRFVEWANGELLDKEDIEVKDFKVNVHTFISALQLMESFPLILPDSILGTSL